VDAERTGALNPRRNDAATGVPARIRGAGLKSTRQRALVLTTLDELRGHRTADELVAELADRGSPLPRSTVFNTLDDLSRVGLVLRAEVGTGAVRYESALVEPHQHFVCRKCGSFADVVADVSSVDMAPVVAGRQVDSVEVIFRGVCERCAASA
jgi:Fe2+ or Zn2+ uptake regulation protein